MMQQLKKKGNISETRHLSEKKEGSFFPRKVVRDREAGSKTLLTGTYCAVVSLEAS